jgi:hypothetical protein
MQLPVLARPRVGIIKSGIPRIDWSNPLSFGLVGCYVPGVTGGFNLAGLGGNLALGTGSTSKQTALGASVDTASANSQMQAVAPAAFTNWTFGASLYWLGNKYGAATGNSDFVGIEYNTAGTSPFWFIGLVHTTNEARCVWNASGSYNDTSSAGTFNAPVGINSLLGTFQPSGNVVLYAGGIAKLTKTMASAPQIGAGAPITIGGYATAGATSWNNCSDNLVYIWNRPLSAAEALILDQDRFGLLIWPDDDLFGELVGAAAAAGPQGALRDFFDTKRLIPRGRGLPEFTPPFTSFQVPTPATPQGWPSEFQQPRLGVFRQFPAFDEPPAIAPAPPPIVALDMPSPSPIRIAGTVPEFTSRWDAFQVPTAATPQGWPAFTDTARLLRVLPARFDDSPASHLIVVAQYGASTFTDAAPPTRIRAQHQFADLVQLGQVPTAATPQGWPAFTDTGRLLRIGQSEFTLTIVPVSQVLAGPGYGTTQFFDTAPPTRTRPQHQPTDLLLAFPVPTAATPQGWQSTFDPARLAAVLRRDFADLAGQAPVVLAVTPSAAWDVPAMRRRPGQEFAPAGLVALAVVPVGSGWAATLDAPGIARRPPGEFTGQAIAPGPPAQPLWIPGPEGVALRRLFRAEFGPPVTQPVVQLVPVTFPAGWEQEFDRRRFRGPLLVPDFASWGPGVIPAILRANLIATLRPRIRIAYVMSNTMAQTNDLYPAIDAAVENETVTWDFGPMLQPGVTIQSVASLTCSVFFGADPSPASRLIGGFQIGVSPSSGAPNQAVYQLVGGMLDGVIYRLLCVVQTSDGQQPSGWTRLICRAPN